MEHLDSSLDWFMDDPPGARNPAIATTYMMRHLPRKYTAEALMDELDTMSPHPGQTSYNFAHVPWGRSSKFNMGYAFVNFLDAETACYMVEQMAGQPWKFWRCTRKAEIVPAYDQGFARNLSRFYHTGAWKGDHLHSPVVIIDGKRVALTHAWAKLEEKRSLPHSGNAWETAGPPASEVARVGRRLAWTERLIQSEDWAAANESRDERPGPSGVPVRWSAPSAPAAAPPKRSLAAVLLSVPLPVQDGVPQPALVPQVGPLGGVSLHGGSDDCIFDDSRTAAASKRTVDGSSMQSGPGDARSPAVDIQDAHRQAWAQVNVLIEQLMPLMSTGRQRPGGA
uniref:Mei2-like C-terminal RNA recognition motif domain-containing protein n=1 Tax=Zooxanthella nutricula TaxID=1333877 RepID=A0A7S2J255_9DINO